MRHAKVNSKLMKHVVKTIITLVICNSALFAQNKVANLKRYFSSLVENKQFNGSVIVAENGKVIYQESFGYANFENKIANTENTAFAIASISKTFNATAVLQLAQSKKLGVEDAVKKILPWFPYDSVKIQHLLSHTSGLPPYNAFFDSIRKQQPARIFTNVDLKEGMLSNAKPLRYNPGDRGNYDNINFIVLALLIEKISGMSYPAYIEKYILQPAGMKHTFFMPMRAQYDDKSVIPLAYPYLYPHRYSDSIVRATKVPYIVDYWSTYNFSGFGDYVSCVTDLLLYDEAYYSSKLLQKESKEKAFMPVKLNDGKTNPANFGLGWEVAIDTTFGKVVYHNGNATGLSCILIRNISKHQTIAVFDNIHSDNSETIGFNALKILNGISVPIPKKSLASVYAEDLLKNGPASAREKLYQLKKDTLHYLLSEGEMNLLGYDFMGGVNNPNPFRFTEEQKYPEALETFKLIKELFPQSWNAYDSYGEILVMLGNKEQAIKMYKRSIELNPKNEGGKKILELLLKNP